MASASAERISGRLVALCSVAVGPDQSIHGEMNGRTFRRWSDAVERSLDQWLERRQLESLVVQGADSGDVYISLQGFTETGLSTAVGDATYELVFVAPAETARGGAQSPLVTATIALAEALGALQGQLHPLEVGEVGVAAYPALELDMIGAVDDLPVMRFGAMALSRFLRTPAWLVYLTEGHIDVLGGLEAIKETAPAEVVAAASGALLLVSDDPMVQGLDARCDRLRDYLGRLAVDPAAVLADLHTTRGVSSRPGEADDSDPSLLGPRAIDGEPAAEGPDGTIHVVLREEAHVRDTYLVRELIDRWYHMGAVDSAFGGGFHSLDYLPCMAEGHVAVSIDFGLSNRESALTALTELLHDELGERVEITVGPIGWPPSA